MRLSLLIVCAALVGANFGFLHLVREANNTTKSCVAGLNTVNAGLNTANDQLKKDANQFKEISESLGGADAP